MWAGTDNEKLPEQIKILNWQRKIYIYRSKLGIFVRFCWYCWACCSKVCQYNLHTWHIALLIKIEIWTSASLSLHWFWQSPLLSLLTFYISQDLLSHLSASTFWIFLYRLLFRIAFLVAVCNFLHMLPHRSRQLFNTQQSYHYLE